jgi:hypothetical protein
MAANKSYIQAFKNDLAEVCQDVGDQKVSKIKIYKIQNILTNLIEAKTKPYKTIQQICIE